MKELITLFTSFFKIGIMTFGGGYAMLPVIQREIVDSRGWASDEELMNYYAIGQCTPGLIGINTATFIGEKRKGIPGGIIATLGFATPSLVIITFIAAVLENFSHYAAVQNAFAGIRACVCILIANAILKLRKNSVVDRITLCIFSAVLLLTLFTSASPAVLVIISGAAGIMIRRWKERHGK